jgi:CheY-like chemotaxis protein
VVTPPKNDSMRRVAIVDDNPDSRRHLARVTTLAGFEPALLENHYPKPDDLFQAIRAVNAGRALCDNRLREGNYAGFDGALAVDALYQRRFPAILVTDYTAPDINTIRLHRRRIPVLVPGSELRPERITRGFEQIEQEIMHDQLPLSRRPRRALVEVDEIIQGPRGNLLTVFVPRWREHEAIVLPQEILPKFLRGSVRRGTILIASINTEAERSEDLFFEEFELVPDEDLNHESA